MLTRSTASRNRRHRRALRREAADSFDNRVRMMYRMAPVRRTTRSDDGGDDDDVRLTTVAAAAAARGSSGKANSNRLDRRSRRNVGHQACKQYRRLSVK